MESTSSETVNISSSVSKREPKKLLHTSEYKKTHKSINAKYCHILLITNQVTYTLICIYAQLCIYLIVLQQISFINCLELIYRWKEKSNLTLSTVTQKSVQEVTATSIQKLSSSSLDSDNLIGRQFSNDAINITPPGSMDLSLRPIVNSPHSPDDGNVLENTSLQNKFIAMTIKDEHGNEIGQLMQQNQQKQSVNSSSFVSTVDNQSSSIMQQTSAISQVEGRQETPTTSSSVSCSSYSSAQKQKIVSSTTKSLSSIKSSQSIEKVVKSSIAVAKNQIL